MDLKNFEDLGESFGSDAKGKGDGIGDAFKKLVEGMTNIPKIMVVDPKGVSTDTVFDDSVSITSNDRKVRGIVVRSGYIVDGVQLLFSDGSQSEFHGNANGGTKTVIQFDEGDALLEISGQYAIPYIAPSGDSISQMVIKTVKGKSYGPFGTGGSAKKFTVSVPKDGEFVGFCGSIGNPKNRSFLAQIGLLYKKK